jgi:hypothetical protein
MHLILRGLIPFDALHDRDMTDGGAAAHAANDRGISV